MTHDRPGRESGSTLVSALALAAVLATLAVLAINITLNSAFVERRRYDELLTQSVFETAFSEALFRATDQQERIRFGNEIGVLSGGNTVRVVFFSPAGKLDINYASPLLLSMVLEASGAADPDALAAAIVDWRDHDDLRSNNGAEVQEYEAQDLPPPANRPFRAVPELLDVMGMEAEVFQCLQGHVTISSHMNTPDLDRASQWLRAALVPGESGSSSQRLQPMVTIGAGDLLGLRMHAENARGLELAASVLVRITGDPQQPYLIQAWDTLSTGAIECNQVRL